MSAIATATAREAVRLRASLSRRHSLRAEAVLVLGLYGLYELARGLVVGDTTEANRHALRLVALERSLHLFLEADVQRAAHSIPGLISLLGLAYLTLHLSVTAGVLLWLHRRRPAAAVSSLSSLSIPGAARKTSRNPLPIEEAAAIRSSGKGSMTRPGVVATAERGFRPARSCGRAGTLVSGSRVGDGEATGCGLAWVERRGERGYRQV